MSKKAEVRSDFCIKYFTEMFIHINSGKLHALSLLFGVRFAPVFLNSIATNATHKLSTVAITVY